MDATTRGGARQRTLVELLPVVGVALAAALGVTLVVGPTTSNLRARLSLVDRPASVQAGSPDATTKAGVTVQVRPSRAGTPAALLTGDLGRPLRASTNPTGPANSTDSSARNTNVRIAPVSRSPLVVPASGLPATPSPTLAAPALTAPVAPPPPELSLAAAPTKRHSKPLRPAKGNSSTAPRPNAGRDSSPLAAGVVAADASLNGGAAAATSEKAASKAEASAEKAADKADRPEHSASTKKDRA